MEKGPNVHYLERFKGFREPPECWTKKQNPSLSRDSREPKSFDKIKAGEFPLNFGLSRKSHPWTNASVERN